VARRWLDGKGGQDADREMDDDLAAFGASEADRERFRAAVRDAEGEDDDGDMPILPENWDAVGVFCACSGQWLVAPGGQRLGLLYTSLESCMRMMGIADPADCFGRVRVIESEALRLLAEKDR
jgi:hypothetical protein